MLLGHVLDGVGRAGWSRLWRPGISARGCAPTERLRPALEVDPAGDVVDAPRPRRRAAYRSTRIVRRVDPTLNLWSCGANP